MKKSFGTQKNVNRTVKDEVKYLLIWIYQMQDDHYEIVAKETAYQQSLETAEKGREKRHKMLNRAQARILTNIVLLNERSSLKRTRSLNNDDYPEEKNHKEKRTPRH